MTRLRLVGAGLALAAAGALAPAVVAAPPHGIVGHVSLGPVSPLGDATRPYVAAVEIVGQSRSWGVRSGADGTFAIVVPPGRYTVRGLAVARLPRAPYPILVVVGPRSMTVVSLVYDSGVR